MSQLTPSLLALKSELGRGIRRDRERRMRWRRGIRVGSLSLIGAVLLSGGALAAAGDIPLAEVQFARGVSVEAVKSYPEFVGRATSSGFRTSSTGPGDPYIYHVTGGEAREIGCGPTDPHPTNNIYITSTRPLTAAEIKSQLRPDGELEGHTPRLPGVIGESNGCPNPGLGGQPGSDDTPAAAGKGAVTVAPSDRTPAILPNAHHTPGRKHEHAAHHHQKLERAPSTTTPASGTPGG